MQLCSLLQSCAVLCSLVQTATERPAFSVAYQVGWPRRRRRRGKGIAPQCRCRPGVLWSPAKFWTSSEPFKHKTLVQFCSILFNCVHLFFFFIFFFVHFVHFAHFVHFVYSFLVLCQLSVYVLLFARFIRAVSISQRRKSQEERKWCNSLNCIWLWVPSGRCWSSSYKDGAAHTPTGYWRLGQAHGFVSNSPKRLPT